MAQLFKPSDLIHTATFETYKTTPNPINGNPKKDYQTLFVKKAGTKRRSMSQQYQIAGTTFSDTVLIGVRHDERIVKGMGVFYRGVHYKVEDVSFDDTNNYITYDLVSLKVVSGNG